MSKGAQRHVLIVGAGLAGALLARMLGGRGHRVTLCERRPDPRARGFIGGRSINLALSTRGLTALERVGLAERVLGDAIPMPGRMMHAESGRLTYQAYSSDPNEAINSVSRGGLNLTLLHEAAACDGVELRFGQRCVDIDMASPAATFHDEATGDERRVEADAIVGADGAFSAVRGRMQREDRFDFSQSYLEHGYKELTIPPAAACGVDPSQHDGFAMEPHALHIWPRGGSMMIALPNADRTFTCTLFWPFEGPGSFAEVTPERAMAFFDERFPDAVPLMPSLEQEFRENPVSSLVTVRCRPWSAGGRVVILGDAAHAIVPFYGQGMNAAFEDCRVLDEMLEAAGDDLGATLPAFAAKRKPDADAIADLALVNFVEMRDRVADPAFLLRKRIEHALHELDGARFVPQYNLVSFSNVPYAEARRTGQRVIDLAERLVGRIGVETGRALTDEDLARQVEELIAAEGAAP